MSEEAPRRRLAAILAADVIGYSRLMQADEVGTLAALKSSRSDVLQPLVAKHHGRIVKLMGDGVLIEFGSAVDAVECAVRLQEGMVAANADRLEDKRIVLRIGINLGDVMVEGGDLYGDGVNVAARLEALAEPGGVLISQTVQGQVRGKLPFAFEDLGEQLLKNMAEAVRVYRVSIEVGAGSAVEGAQSGTVVPSIAILPFVNMSSDPNQQYLSDGITEDIITELSRYRELLVIARNSSFQYRDKSIDMKRVGRELGAEYLVEGSLRRSGDRLRITAQLVEAASGSHLWAERYDRDVSEVFEIQDEITQTIAARLVGQVARSRADKVQRTPTTKWKAYDYALQGLQYVNMVQPQQAEVLLKTAIKIDPNYAQAHALLADAYLYQYFENLEDDLLMKSLTSAKRAALLDDNNPYGHCGVGIALVFLGKLDEAEAHLDKAIQLNPNSVWCAAFRAAWLNRMGRTQESLATLDTMVRRDPFLPHWYWELRATALFMERRYEESIKATLRKQELQYWDHAHLAAAYAHLGRDREARAEVAEVLRKRPNFTTRWYAKQEPYKNPADRDHLLEGFRKAGLPE
jgi:adenylate cyclase